MPYTHTWDNTAPADSRLLSLGAGDIRDMKLDIQERLNLAGLLSARPTPEAGFAGVLFVATDINIVYQWTGSVWVPFFGINRFSDMASHAIVGSTVAAGSSVTLSVGSLRVGSVVRFTFAGALTAGSGLCTLRPTLANVSLGNISVGGAVGAGYICSGEFVVESPTSFQTAFTAFDLSSGNLSFGRNIGTSAFDIIANAPIFYLNCTVPASTTLTSNHETVIVTY